MKTALAAQALRRFALFGATFLVAASALAAPFANFVTRSGDKLMDGTTELRFISTNMPDVLQIITNKPFDSTSFVRLPDAYELRDAVVTVKQLGGQVMRTFTITAKNGSSAEHMFNVSSNPVTPNEAALRVLDKLLQICNEENIRVYIPLIAYSNANRGDPDTYGTNFWTVGSATNLKFKNMVSQLLNRTNFYTGVQYKNDKAILGWQSGNELVIGTDATKQAWLHDIAAYVKGIDGNHLFMDGRNRPDDIYNIYSGFFSDANIDVVCYHTYVNLSAFNTPASTLQAMRAYTQGKRPLVVSEIAMYTTESALTAFINEQIANGTSGSNWWGHRFRNRDGGFYRHSDNGSLFEDLNWPGFPGTSSYLPDIAKALSLQNILANGAYQIRGLTRPPLPVPAAPTLLSISDVGHISWEGSTGAQSFDISRAASASGPWTVIKSDYYDNLVNCDSLFCDDSAVGGATYYYRVVAKNSSGSSSPSNVVGPVTVGSNWLVDDLFDLSRVASSSNVQVKKGYNHYNYQNDLAVLVRSNTSSASSVTYQVSGHIKSVIAYLHQSTSNPTFQVSTNGSSFTTITATPTSYGTRKLFAASVSPSSGYRYLRIQLNTATTTEAIGRVEIEYDQTGSPPPTSVTFEAEALTRTSSGATTSVESDSPASGGQWVKLNSTAAGQYVQYTTPSIPAGTYQLQYRYKTSTARGRHNVTLDGTAIGSTVDEYAAGSSVYVAVTLGTRTFSSSGTHTIRLTVAGANSSSTGFLVGSDCFTFVPTASTVTLEAESLARTSSGATTSVESDSPASGGQWVKLNSTAAGQYVQYTTPSIPAGTYQLQYRYKTSTARGRHNVTLDGTAIGSTVDEYAAGSSVYVAVTLGTRTFSSSGTHTIRLTVSGANSSSTGFLLGSDRFVFTP